MSLPSSSCVVHVENMAKEDSCSDSHQDLDGTAAVRDVPVQRLMIMFNFNNLIIITFIYPGEHR